MGLLARQVVYRLGYKEAVALGVIVPTRLCVSNTTEAYARHAEARGLALDSIVQPRYTYGGGYGQAEAAELLVTAIEVQTSARSRATRTRAR